MESGIRHRTLFTELFNMLKRRSLIRLAIFLLILLFSIHLITLLFLPKNYIQTSQWPATSNVEGFYSLERDSLDVLFLGSSKSYTSFIPHLLYRDYGIQSYNLGTDLQSGFVSYYLLKDVFLRQHPKAVVLEMSGFFPLYSSLPLNAPEAMLRKALDPMPWSESKLQAILDLRRLDNTQDWKSYFFPVLRFHDRWKDLNEDDFTADQLKKHYEYLGFSPLYQTCGLPFEPLNVEAADHEAISPAPFHPIMEQYLDQIVSLCLKNSCELILVSTPDDRFSVQQHMQAAKFAQQHQLLYLDYNEASLYNGVKYCFAEDNADYEHPSLSGARKLTSALGDTLRRHISPVAQDSPLWKQSMFALQEMQTDLDLVREPNPSDYLQLLKNPRYTVFMLYDAALTPSQTLNSVFSSARDFLIGILSPAASFEDSFFALIEGGNCTCFEVDESSCFGSFRSGRSIYHSCIGAPTMLQLDDISISANQDGVLIVVYDTARRMILDAVTLGSSFEKVSY